METTKTINDALEAARAYLAHQFGTPVEAPVEIRNQADFNLAKAALYRAGIATGPFQTERSKALDALKRSMIDSAYNWYATNKWGEPNRPYRELAPATV